MPNHPHTQAQAKRFDRLLCQQHLARRFRDEYPEEFKRLRTLRDDLHDVLKTTMGPKTSTRRRLGALAAWLTVLEYREGQSAVREDDREKIALMAGFALMHENWVNIKIEATRVLTKHVEVAELLTRQFNYFEHFSFLSMSSICEGEELTQWFDTACNSKLPKEILSQLEDSELDEPEYRWFLTSQEKLPFDLQCALHASVERERFYSDTLTILDSRSNSMTAIDEDGLALYLRIGLARAPGDIDKCLRYLRGALEERLAEEHGFLIPGYEAYRTTDFSQATASRPMVFEQRLWLQPAILGLWCWDLTRYCAMSAAQAIEHVRKQRTTWGCPDTPGPKSVRAQHNDARDLILPPSGISKLDEAVIGLLGVRFGRVRSGEEKPEPLTLPAVPVIT